MSRLTILALAASLLAVPALAGDRPPVFVVSGPVKDKPAVALDSTRAYAMLRTDVMLPLYLMKVPSEADQAAYDKLRAEALAEAREKYAKKLASYERAMRATPVAGARPPERPVEPTEANFEFTSFGLMAGVAIGPLNRFAKGEGGASTYLQELTPGEYRVYGPITVMPNGVAMGSCFCMGSVKFEARAGEITDLGVIFYRATPLPTAPAGDSSWPMLVTVPNYLGPAPADLAIDSRIGGFPVRRAAYRPVGKLPNYFGVTIGRIPEMPGVLRYDRDRIVDLTGDG